MKHILIALTLVLFASCSKDDTPKDYSVQNDQEIKDYLAQNNLEAQKTNTGLYYIIDEQGSGDKATFTDRVKVSYNGYYADGTTFDESPEEGYSFNLQNVISGWTEGISYFNEGGTGKLLIPAHLAYGSDDYNGIPGGSVLIFDIELIYVNYKTENDQEIQSYLEENDLEAEHSDTGLYYIINELGTGEQATVDDDVTITYKGYLTNGDVFDERVDDINFNLSGVISGFSEGLSYFKEGGSGTLLMPAHLAYGNTATSTIPAGSVLIFDFELKSVN